MAANLLLFATLNAASSSASAQPLSDDKEAAPGSVEGMSFEELTGEERRELLSRLTDEQVREVLLRQIEASDAAARADAPLIVSSAQRLEDASERLLLAFANLPEHLGGLYQSIESVLDWTVISLFLALILAGGFAEWLYRRFGLGLLGAARSDAANGGNVGPILVSLLWHIMAFICFAAAVVVAFMAMRPGEQEAAMALASLGLGLLIFRGAEMMARFFLKPPDPALSMFSLGGDATRRLYRYSVALILIVSLAYAIRALLTHIEADARQVISLQVLFGTLFLGAFLAAIWHLRRPVADSLSRSGQEMQKSGALRRSLAANWHVAMTIVALLVYVAAAMEATAEDPHNRSPGLVTLLALGLWLFGDRLLARSQNPRQGDAEGAATSTLKAQQVVLIRTARMLMVVLFLWTMSWIWGIDLMAYGHETLGGVVMRGLLTAAGAALIGYLIWETARIAIDRRLQLEGVEADEPAMGEAGGGSGSRLGTLLPLIKRFVQVSLIIVLGLVVLASLGVNVAPLIAGAGVVGIAIGFGAQTLIRDIVSGLFFLLDDAFRVGEFVDTGDVQGTVEGINVRSLVLRHYEGYLHTVPYGEIRYLTNWSRDWATLRVKFRVPFETDMEKVRKIIKRIGKELLEDPELGPYILQPLKSQGVVSMDDSAMILRAKFTAKPGWQWTIRKEVYARVQKAFEEAGIKFAYRRVVVDVGSPGEQPSEKQIAAAAEQAIERDDGEAPKKSSL